MFWNYHRLKNWPWCCKYNGGVWTFDSEKYFKTQLNSAVCRPSGDVGRWKSMSWQWILSHEKTVTTFSKNVISFPTVKKSTQPFLVRTSVAPIHFRVLCSLPSCSEPWTSNPRVQAASTIFCSRSMLGIAVRDGPCVPHAEYMASLYVVFCSNEDRSIWRFR